MRVAKPHVATIAIIVLELMLLALIVVAILVRKEI